MSLSLPDVPPVDPPGLYGLLQRLRQGVIDIGSRLDLLGDGGASTGAAGGRDPPSFVLDYGAVGNGSTNNDGAFTAYETDASVKNVYVRDGVYNTTRLRTAFNKHYEGHGQIVNATIAMPAKYRYMGVKPTTWPVQGENGWFLGDQWFTDGGEWHVIGAGVRTYDLTTRYFESNVLPHHAWLDVESGNSGIAGYATGGVSPGTTITLSGAASAEWVGKQAQINQSFGGTKLAGPLTVQSVAGNTVTFSSAHSVSMGWNPAGGQSPNLSFALRTFAAHRYIRVRARAGGDIYGDLVRVQIEYNPKPSELDHVFNTMTGAQYGGSVDFKIGSDGTYCTGWESQYNAMTADGAPDVCVRVKVDSLVRDNDRSDRGGRSWTGNYMSSTGKRPCDAANVVLGFWRRGLDMTPAAFSDGSYLTVAAGSGATSVTVKWPAGARKDYGIRIGTFSAIVTAIAGNVITFTPALTSSFPVDTIVDFPTGGAAIHMAQDQWINFDGRQTTTGRSGDPLNIWPTGWGNETGQVWMGTTTDVTSLFLGIYNGDARIRFRPTGLQCNVNILGGAQILASQDLQTGSSTINANFAGAVVFGLGLGDYIVYNTATLKYEFYVGNVKVAQLP